MQDIRVEPGLSCETDSHCCENNDQISRHAVILVYRLSLVDRAEHVGCIELSNTNNELNAEQDVYHQANLAVSALEASLRMRSLVHLNHDQTSDQEAQGDDIEARMYVGSLHFLLLCRRGLK